MSGYPRPGSVRPIPLADVIAALGAIGVPSTVRSEAAASPDGVTVTGITLASASVRPGDLFAALPGANAHGARFAHDAVRAGAVAVLTDPAGADVIANAIGDEAVSTIIVDDPRAVLGEVAALVYDHPSRALTLIGITGTAGKSTTSYLIESGLRASGATTGMIGTVETRLGETTFDSVRTTPEASDLHALFAVAVEQGVSSLVMEVSSHALALGRVGGAHFAVGGYTNFGSDHLDFHRDAADYFAAKAMLFDGRCDVEILNHDDAALDVLRKPATITYSAAGDTAATWYASDIVAEGYRQRFIAHGPDGLAIEAGVGLPGRHNVANALLALASLVAVRVDPQVAADGIAACRGVPGRLERVGPQGADGPVTGVVDYAHKPDSIVAVLAALRATTDGRLICVLGAGGDRDRGKRPIMGAAAAAGSDLLIITDDNPRTEDPAVIRAEVLRGAIASGAGAGAGAGAEIVEVDGRRAAIAEAVRRARPGDVIAVLGKGHERGQEICGEVHPFDDRIELAAALADNMGSESRAESPSRVGSQSGDAQ